MRPSVQKTLLLALGAALLSSALGASGSNVAAVAKVQPVRIVVLPSQKQNTAFEGGHVDRLLQEARFKRIVSGLKRGGPSQTGEAAGVVPYARTALVERVRRRLLAEPGQDGR